VASKPQPRSAQRRSTRGVRYETDLTRRIDIRAQRRTVLVVTNGERTERDYLDALKEERWVIVTLRVKFERGTSEDVVVRAVRVRASDEYDNVWAVCDVDEEDVSAAIQQAKDGEVDLALSMPCFEVWLILHHSSRCPGFNNATQADVYLRKFVPAWDKTNLRFSDFRDGVANAVERAKQLGEPPQANPSTAVWRLVESIREDSELRN
jgi:RloB-like protein